MIRFKLAVRNITRHHLRSLLSISMIAGAITAMVLFQGFSNYSLAALKWIAAENQYGNMQIAQKKYWAPGKESRTERLFAIKDLEELKARYPQIERMSGRLSFYGLVSNNDLSVGANVIGIDSVGEPQFKKSMRMIAGNFFEASDDRRAVVGLLLSRRMNVAVGDSITILTNTIDGVMNAMDITVSGIFSAGIDEIDSQVIYIPLVVTQELLDTPQVDIAVIKFNKLEMAESNLEKINQDLSQAASSLTARSWRQLAVLFRQVDNFYGVQNRLIECILLALMFLGILNTVSMTVVERTGEIGTLRALGESRKMIVTQFLLESLMIAIIGILCGVVASYGIIQIVESVKIMTEMPGASEPFQVKIYFLMTSVGYASALALITTVFATMIPAMRASKMDIVEALRKNV